MRLVNASRYFDDVVIRDAYTNVFLFKGQVAAYIDSQVDGTISRRRTISLASNLVLPTRRALEYGSEIWLVGDGIKDHLQNVALRTSYATKKCDALYTIRTPGNACLNTGGTAAYGQADYLKSTVNAVTESEYSAQYDISFSSSEAIARGYILSNGSVYYHIRGVHTLLEGFQVAESDILEAAFVTAVFTEVGTYDPITDTYGSGTATTTGLLMDMVKLYEFRTALDPENHKGDKTLLVASSAVTPKVGQSVSAQGSWRIMSVLPYQDAWYCQLRRA